MISGYLILSVLLLINLLMFILYIRLEKELIKIVDLIKQLCEVNKSLLGIYANFMSDLTPIVTVDPGCIPKGSTITSGFTPIDPRSLSNGETK